MQNRYVQAAQATVATAPITKPTVFATPAHTPIFPATPDPRVMVDECQTLAKPGWYQLASDLAAGKGDCLKVQASDVK